MSKSGEWKCCTGVSSLRASDTPVIFVLKGSNQTKVSQLRHHISDCAPLLRYKQTNTETCFIICSLLRIIMYKTNSQKAIQNEYHISAYAYCQTHWNDTDDASSSKPSSKCLSSFILVFHLHWKRIHSRQHSTTQRCIKQFQTDDCERSGSAHWLSAFWGRGLGDFCRILGVDQNIKKRIQKYQKWKWKNIIYTDEPETGVSTDLIGRASLKVDLKTKNSSGCNPHLTLRPQTIPFSSNISAFIPAL